MPPTATVAHEGNPRTNTLTVSGTLDGDVVLIPTPTIPIPPTEPPTEPPASQGWQAFPSGAAKYTVATEFRYGVDVRDNAGDTQDTNSILVSPETFIPVAGTILEYSEKSRIPLYGMIRSPKILTNRRYYDSQVSVLVPITQDFPAIDFQDVTVIDYNRYKKPASPFAPWNTITLRAQAIVSVAGVGAPFSGSAVGVKPDSTQDNFTGIVSAYNWGDGFQYLMRYDHMPLSGPGVLLASAARDLLVVDDSVNLSLRYSIATGLFDIFDNANSLSNQTIDIVPYFGADMRVALIDLPPTVNSPIDSLVVWKQVAGTIFGQ